MFFSFMVNVFLLAKILLEPIAIHFECDILEVTYA